MDISIREILTAVQGRWTGTAPAAASRVSGVSTDTRTVEKGDVFFALKGHRFDGHDYLKDAAQKGARCLVVSETPDLAKFKEPPGLIRVADTLTAYGDLAKFYRQNFKI